jgi:hypothetical protein
MNINLMNDFNLCQIIFANRVLHFIIIMTILSFYNTVYRNYKISVIFRKINVTWATLVYMQAYGAKDDSFQTVHLHYVKLKYFL